MKKHMSVLMLAAGCWIYKLLALIIAMAVAQTGLFLLAMNRKPEAALERVLTASRVSWVFAGAFLLMTGLLLFSGFQNGGSKSNYSLRRLSVGESSVFLCWAAGNCLCLLILWAAEAMIMLGLCKLFTLRAEPSLVSGQTVFLAFYRSPFLHSLMPLEEISRWIRNLFMLVSLGAATASASFRQRRGDGAVAVYVLTGLALLSFVGATGRRDTDVILSLVFAVVSGFSVLMLLGEDAYEN